MKNYETVMARYNSLKENFNLLLERKQKKSKNPMKWIQDHDFVTEYNSLLRQLHNTEINLNQIKMRALNH